jgi:hypothetical membrane protein
MLQGNLYRLSSLDLFLRGSGIAAAIIFTISVITAGALHPDYSHLTQAISELGAKDAPYQDILNYGGLIPAGILTFIFSIGMFRNIRGNTFLYISSGLVMLIGLGRFFAGVFPCDPGCATFTSTSAKIHAFAGLAALTSGAIAPLVMAFGLRSHQPRKYYFLSLGLGVGAVIIIMTGMLGSSKLYVGAVQRLLLLFTYLWIIVVSVGIESIGNRTSSSSNPTNRNLVKTNS